MVCVSFLRPLHGRAGEKLPGRFIVCKGTQGFLELCLSQVPADDERCTDLQRIRASPLFENSEPGLVQQPELRHGPRGVQGLAGLANVRRYVSNQKVSKRTTSNMPK